MARWKAFWEVRRALKLYDRKAYVDAEAALGRALACRPDLPEADQYRGILALKQGRLEEALGHLRRAWEKEEDIPVAVALGAAELLTGRFDEARDHFEKAIAAFPVLYDLRFHVGLAWFRQKKRRRAVAEFHRMVQGDDEPLFTRLDRLRRVAAGGQP